jgi:hypothetical protein
MSEVSSTTFDTSNRISVCNTFGFIPKDGPVFKVSDGRDYIATKEFKFQIAKMAVRSAVRRARYLCEQPLEAADLAQCFSGAGSTETGIELDWGSMNFDEVKRAVQGIPRSVAEALWKAPTKGIKHGINRALEREANAMLLSAEVPSIDWGALVEARQQQGDEDLLKEIEETPESVFEIFPVSGIEGSWDYIPGRTKAVAFEAVVRFETNDHLAPTEQTNAILERIANEENFGTVL